MPQPRVFAHKNDVAGAEDTQTNIWAHYRIPMGKGGWVGPEIAMQTVEDAGKTEDEEITSIRWLMRVGF